MEQLDVTGVGEGVGVSVRIPAVPPGLLERVRRDAAWPPATGDR
jgi:hypothetical protein